MTPGSWHWWCARHGLFFGTAGWAFVGVASAVVYAPCRVSKRYKRWLIAKLVTSGVAEYDNNGARLKK